MAYAERSVLSDVSLSVNTGELLVLLGPNGSGKSTLVKAISAQLSPTRGRVLIDGQPLCGDSSSHRSVGVVPQSIALFLRLSVWENLRAFGALMGVDEPHIDERAEAVLTTIGLPDRRDDPVGALSGGMQRRVNIGVALICEPRLLLLDEPSVGVDRQGR
ncbi:MAG: ABC transporter ATP-binding protein, partial [Chromatiales bacterium]|nr:ABC transporter ATP-binding protein [Chromatiales bacterium]